jgi:hypothetical protein
MVFVNQGMTSVPYSYPTDLVQPAASHQPSEPKDAPDGVVRKSIDLMYGVENAVRMLGYQ